MFVYYSTVTNHTITNAKFSYLHVCKDGTDYYNLLSWIKFRSDPHNLPHGHIHGQWQLNSIMNSRQGCLENDARQAGGHLEGFEEGVDEDVEGRLG